MCVPWGKSRKKQQQTQAKLSSNDTVSTDESCEESPKEEAPKKPDPTLTGLEVTGATPLGGNRYWALKDSRSKVRVKAVTTPPNTPVTWTGGTGTASPVVQEVDLSNVGDIPVKASLDCEKSVTIEIYDLVSVTCALPTSIGAQTWKSYVSTNTTRLTATTSPDAKKVWDLLAWSEGAAGAENKERDVDLTPVGDRTVTVSLGRKSLPVNLHICQWPRLKIKEVTFDCHEVLNDGEAEIDVPFDKKWKDGRADPAANQPAAGSQSPVCYTRNTKAKASAVFEVTLKATDSETVKVKAVLPSGTIQANVAVAAGADTATMALTEADTPLPNQVDWDDQWKMKWQSILEDDSTWVDAGTSTHLLYLLLGDPIPHIYFTLLDIACRGAKGESTEAGFADKSFAPYKTHVGDGKGFQRKGDDKRLSYYKTGYNIAANDTTWTPRGMLSSPEATGRCGGWALFLRYMWAIHGVQSGQRWYIRAIDTTQHETDQRFLVKNVTFNVGSLTGLYTHEGEPSAGEVVKVNGVPGQGKTNPQFDFGDHVIVRYGGKLYDPSYGVGPYTNDKDYLAAALDGLAFKPAYEFTMSDGTKQFISEKCVPYNKGFARYKIARAETLDDIAAEFGTTSADILLHDTELAAKRGTADKVVPGDVVNYKGNKERVLKAALTFDTIAAAYGLSKQTIFDAAANAGLKARRKDVGAVKNGDTIVVDWRLIPDGVWVIGHDQ